MATSGKSISAPMYTPAQQQVGVYSNYLNQITKTASENSAFNAAQAAENRNWQAQQNKIAMDFNAAEAAKNRDWQKMMSDTAHQREVVDLKAAGLNPVLSAMGGNGASVTSGATASGVTSSGGQASADTSANSALVSLLGSMLNAQTQLANTATNAMANLSVADKYTQMSKYTAELGAQTSLYTADTYAAAQRYSSDNSLQAAQISAAATKFSAETHADASKVAAAIGAAAQRYGANMSNLTQNQVAQINAEVNRELKAMGIKADFDLQSQEIMNSMLKAQYSGGIMGSGISIGTLTDAISDLFLGGTGSGAKSRSSGYTSAKSFSGSRGAGFSK